MKRKERHGTVSELTVGITGATGFIGCRLAERLTLAGDYDVVGVVRRFSGPGLARLARLPVRFAQADLLDPSGLAEAVEGCDVVVHCAYGTDGSREERRRVTVEGTENVLEAACQAGVDRVLHMSSAAVHGLEHPAGEIVDEDSPWVDDPSPYEADKIDAERRVWRYHDERGLPVVVFRPTLVYGPHGRRWTMRIVEEITEGAWLVDGGEAAANLVYVDNLVDAMIAAIRDGRGDGEAFVVVDDQDVSWRDVYEGLAEQMKTAPPMKSATIEEIRAMRSAEEPSLLYGSFVRPWTLVPRILRSGLRPPAIRAELRAVPWLSWLQGTLPDAAVEAFRAEGKGSGTEEAEPRPTPSYPLPSEDMVSLYTSDLSYDTRKLREVLRVPQRVTFADSMERIGAWMRYQRLGGWTSAAPELSERGAQSERAVGTGMS